MIRKLLLLASLPLMSAPLISSLATPAAAASLYGEQKQSGLESTSFSKNSVLISDWFNGNKDNRDRRWDNDRDRRWDNDRDRRWDNNRDRRWDNNRDRRWDNNRDRRWDNNRDRQWNGDQNRRWNEQTHQWEYRR